jgi:PPM family protein phosphatase
MTLTLRYAVRTDPGLVRQTNQDSVYAGPRLLAVADGMGGMAAGDLASSVVIQKLAELDQDVPNAAMIDALDDTVGAANRELHDGVTAHPELRGMGTTLTALLFSGRTIAMVHIGDSRAYLLRDGRLRQVTKDHTYVQMLVDEGAITAEEASHHPHRSLVTHVLQGEPIEPSYAVREAIRGDRYLLCSDGLSNVVTMETMAEVLRDFRDPDACAERLIDLALRAGGPDNITAIVADIVETSPPEHGDPDAATQAIPVVQEAPPARRPSPRPRPDKAPAERDGPAEPAERDGPAEPAGDPPAPEGGDPPAEAATQDPPRRSRLGEHRLTVVLLLALVAIAAAVGVWYAATA